MTELMPASYDTVVKDYAANHEWPWEALERKLTVLTRKTPSAKNEVAGQLHPVDGGGAKKKGKGGSKGGGGGSGYGGDGKRVHSGQSKGNPRSKGGKKRGKPNVDGGGAKASQQKRQRNTSGVPQSHQMGWPCHNCGQTGHFMANCPHPRKTRAQINAARAQTRKQAADDKKADNVKQQGS